ncbi:MAG: hypothetical protein ABEN55_06500, partial [Bradymonadaceae bacterium]
SFESRMGLGGGANCLSGSVSVVSDGTPGSLFIEPANKSYFPVALYFYARFSRDVRRSKRLI